MQSREKDRNTLTSNKSTIWNRIKTKFSKKKPSNPLSKEDKDNAQSATDNDINKNQAEMDEAETKRLSELIMKYQHPPVPYEVILAPYNPNPLTYINSAGDVVTCEGAIPVQHLNKKAKNTLTSNKSTMWNRTQTKPGKQIPSNSLSKEDLDKFMSTSYLPTEKTVVRIVPNSDRVIYRKR